MIVGLRDSALLRAFNLSILRNRWKFINGIRSRKFSRGKSELEVQYVGIVAELAVAGVLGIPYNPPLLLGGDDFDLVDKSGRTIEVKFRNHPKGDFALSNAKPESFQADLGVLVVPLYPEIGDNALLHLVGWITREEFLDRCDRVNYGYGDRLAVERDALRPMGSLIYPN